MTDPNLFPTTTSGREAALADIGRRVSEVLDRHPEGVSEHALIKAVGQQPQGPLPAGALSDALALYQVHFALFNALYQLRDEYRASSSFELSISPLRICLDSYEAGEGGLARDDALRRFYLDWENFDITREEVESLLRYARSLLSNPDKRLQALRTLGLDEDAGLQQIRRRFRELAMRHHPDRGGDADAFREIRQAVEVLTGKSD